MRPLYVSQFVYSPEELPTDDVSKQHLLLPANVMLMLNIKISIVFVSFFFKFPLHHRKAYACYLHYITIFALHDCIVQLSYFHCFK